MEIIESAPVDADLNHLDVGSIADMSNIFNDKLGGGFRRGEFVMIGSVREKYKTLLASHTL